MRHRYTARLTEFGEGGRDLTTRVLAKDRVRASLRATAKLFGPGAFWWRDGGLDAQYGQVFKPLPGGTSTSITNRSKLEIYRGWH